MTVRLSHDVFCDQCGEWYHAFVSVVQSIREARVDARANGWKYVRGKHGYEDLCPTCVHKMRKDC